MKRALVVALALAACAGAREPLPPPAATHASPPRAPDVPVKLLEELALLAVGVPPPEEELASLEDKIARGETSIEAYVASLVNDPRFSRDVAPEIVLNKKATDPSEEVPWETLKSSAPPGKPLVYYLRKPCDARAAIAVRPWWGAPDVLVCPDAYQPDRLREPKTGWYCGGDNLDAERSTFCGCGPSLMNCVRDEEQNAELRRALRLEVTRTVGGVVADDRPIAEAFTTNATHRTAYSELFYQRWRVVRGEIAALPDVSSWKERKDARHESQPGEHAGILTTPHMLLFGDTPRARMRNFYDVLWCEPPASQKVSTSQILALGVTDLRDGAGWKQLAAMPVCESCHARLDYGMQFFAGFPSSFVGLVFQGHASGRGPLYARDIDDPRGEAELTPRAFADLATKQPEFLRCMARDVAEHVFGDAASSEDLRAIELGLAKHATLKAAAVEALLRYARRAPRAAHVDVAWPVAGEGDVDDAGRVTPSAPLRALLQKHCGACHAEGARAFVRDATFDRARLVGMLEAVAFRAMPKGGMRAVDRQRVVHALVAAIWKDPRMQREALRAYGARALPTAREAASLRMIELRAGGRDGEASSWSLYDADRQDTARLTTSVALSIGVAALADCKAAGKSGAALDECLARAAEIEAHVRTR